MKCKSSRPAMEIEEQLTALQTDQCGLRELLQWGDSPDELSQAIRSALDLGLTLRTSLPGIDRQVLCEWLGQRWWLLHQSQLGNQSHWTSIVASRLNRTEPEFRSWPKWIERSLQSIKRDQQTVLLVPGTALAGLIQPIALPAEIDCLTVKVPKLSTAHPALLNWLKTTLREALRLSEPALRATGASALRLSEPALGQESVAHATLWLSPETYSEPQGDSRGSLGEGTSQELVDSVPLADRICFALAHNVRVLNMRAGGNIALLVKHRVNDSRFPSGTVSIRISDRPHRPSENLSDPRAVGWYVPNHNSTARTRHWPKPVSGRLVSWTSSLSLLHNQADYLVHCVRGTDGSAFRRGSPAAVLDAIIQGETPQESPLEVLWKIVAQGRLRASDKLLRAGSAAVSFTAVPLTELMTRRRYQSHLGRWDWEPYGFMIRRDTLVQLGPVQSSTAMKLCSIS